MTLNEYLIDYAKDETKILAQNVIDNELEMIPKEKVKNIAKDYILQMESGKRDFRF